MFYITLEVDRMDGSGHINTARRECLRKKTKVTRYYLATKGLPERRSTSFIKVSGSHAFTKRQPSTSW